MRRFWAVCLSALLFASGCGVILTFNEKLRPVPPGPHGWDALAREPGLAERILALDPANISPADIAGTLAKGPTPWLLAVAPLPPWSEEFLNLLHFFFELGYPPGRVGDPRLPDYRVDWMEPPGVVGGLAAWFYEQDGMAPFLVGWSGGGILVIRVLHELNGSPGTEKVRIVNGRTGEVEDRAWFRDFYTGKQKPMKDLRIPFAAALAAGGLGRVVQPEIWPIVHGLHLVPDTAEEFLGFKAPGDIFGTDMEGLTDGAFVEANRFRPMGTAKVRSIMADGTYHHFDVVHCNDLLNNPEGLKWVQNYKPDPGFGQRDYRHTDKFSLVEGKRILWCGEVWYGLKKHWALSAQRAARAFLERRGASGGNIPPGGNMQ